MSLKNALEDSLTEELHVDERDFEGTLVLESMARIDRLEEFMDAVDDDDLPRRSKIANINSIRSHATVPKTSPPQLSALTPPQLSPAVSRL